MNEQNLRSLGSIPKDELREIGRKGGIRSGEVKRERKRLREELCELLAIGDTQEKISVALIQKALDGDTKAYQLIRDTIGEKPADELNVNGGSSSLSREETDALLKNMIDQYRRGK